MTVRATDSFHVGVSACSLERTTLALKISQDISRGGGMWHFRIVIPKNSKTQGLKMDMSVSK
jgi:hypothetical protein